MYFRPHEYQEISIDHIIKHERCALWAGMGMGKTVSTLTAISLLRALGEITGPVLVLAPLRVVKDTWPKEVQKWDHLKHLRVSCIVGKPAERRQALLEHAEIYAINFENIPWLVQQYKNLEWPYQMIVADESTKLKSYRSRQGGARAQALSKVAFKSERFLELTGTPAPQGLIDLWGQIWFVDKGKRLGKTFSLYKTQYFYEPRYGYGVEPMPGVQNLIQEKLQDVCLTIKAEDYFDLKEPIVHEIRLDMPEQCKDKYRELQRDMVADIQDLLAQPNLNSTIFATSAAAKTMKCLQFANGCIYEQDNPSAWHEVHDMKLKALEEVIEEANGTPVLVAYHFKSDLARLKKHFPKGRALDKNDSTIDEWNKGNIPILFAHPASAGHGLNLQHGGNILCFFSIDWNLENHEQIIERVGPTRQMQSGYKRNVFIYYLIAQGTIEEQVLMRLRKKASVQEALMLAMKRC